MNEHSSSVFAEELRDLSQKIAIMGGLAERSLANSIQALLRNDKELAHQVIENDADIDSSERLIEELSILVIAKRQPVARDLREVLAGIRISADLERVGDLAKNIAKRVLVINPSAVPQSVVLGLEHMSETALVQLKNVLDAHAQRDLDLAVDVWSRDDEVDSMYTSIFRELLTYMIEDPRLITPCTHLLFGAKNIERIGDHATNIAETIHYLISAKPLKAARPKKDGTSFTVLDADDLTRRTET
ncbi:MAG: phosphate signaling complex protein PhoU [Pseudomonadota bacterium]